MVHWDIQQLQLVLSPAQQLRRAVRKIHSAFVNTTSSSYAISIDGHDTTTIVLHLPTHPTPPDMITYQTLFDPLPTLFHWELQVSSTRRSYIPSLSLSRLRLYWHPHWQHINGLTPESTESVPRSLSYPPPFWRRFWRISLPHKALTPWWRLLHNCIATEQKRYRFQLTNVEDAMCTMCKIDEEDTKHMFVSCSTKRPFWRAALSFLQLDHLFPTQDLVWQALTTFLSRRSRPLSDNVLCRLGCIIAVLWQHHWRCKIEDQLWSTEVAYNTLQHDLLYSSFVPSNSPSV